MQRVVVAAPQAAFRKGVRDALQVAVVLEAESSVDIARLADGVLPDLLLVDYVLFGDEVSDWAARNGAVIVLFDRLDDLLMRTAFACGVRGMLSKRVSVEELRHAVQSVANGGQAVSADVLRRLVDRFVHDAYYVRAANGATVRLTRREWEIGELLRCGSNTQAIADELEISPVTVRRHVATLKGKLGVSSRTAAVELLEG